MAFGAGIGFLWLGTVPLTSGLVARVFGVRYLSMLYGVVFASHQLGAFLGAWGGGSPIDVLGSYDSVWLASIGARPVRRGHPSADQRPAAGAAARQEPRRDRAPGWIAAGCRPDRGGLALWWRYGLLVAIADPSWFCLSR